MAVSDQLARAIVQGIHEQMERHAFSDVIIDVKGVIFKCHRFLLSACSRYFRAMFSSGMSEDLSGKVEVKGIDPETFEIVIDCVYKARNVINPDNVMNIWHASNFLQIDFLIDSCELIIAKHLSKENSVEVCMNAKLLDSTKLLKMSRDLIVKEFEYIRKTETLLMLDYEDMIKLVADNTLTTLSEDFVIDAILRWVSFSPEGDARTEEKPFLTLSSSSVNNTNKENLATTVQINKDKDTELIDAQISTVNSDMDTRKAHKRQTKQPILNRGECLPRLLSAARTCLVSTTCIQSLTENKMVLENHEAFAVVMEGLKYQLQPGRRHDYCPPNAIHRNSSNDVNVTIAIYEQAGHLKMSCKTLDGAWFQLAAPVYHLLTSRAVTYENDIYLINTNSKQLGAWYMCKYYSINNTWKPLTTPRVLRNGCDLVVLDGNIYIIGGDNCTTVERFIASDEQRIQGSGRWETVGELMHSVSNTVATVCGKNIIVFGNANSNDISVIQCFDTQTFLTHTCQEDIPGSVKGMISLKYRDDTFLLQESGALWMLGKCDSLSLEFKGMVWDLPMELSSAVICNETLLVLATKVDPQMAREWDMTNNPTFKRVKIFERSANCFLNTIIPKSFLTIKET